MMLLCCRGFARKVPVNYILLTLFTLCMTFFFSFVASLYTAQSCLTAGGMTLGMTIAITVYALCTKTDFTACYGLFFCITVGMLMLMFVSIFVSFTFWHTPVMSAVFVVLYGLYLIYDT